MSEPVIDNDPKGLGVFLIAASEMEMNVAPKLNPGLILMDNYFNRETHNDAFGKNVFFHYKWGERDNGGFSFVEHILHKQGLETGFLNNPPTKKSLKKASLYIIVDPDWPKENKTPNYIQPQDIKAICDYVKKGGVLLLMANDSNNVEFEHYNELTRHFGFQWNINVRHDVKNDHFEDGAVDLSTVSDIFGNTGKAYIKQLCTQSIIDNTNVDVKAVYQENGEVIMTVAHYGKGIVFAVGDPWFYNEYIDGRKLPSAYKNYNAADALFKWLIAQKK
jgi:unsaturated rhamnogalacturonyl hydrolase